MNKPVRTTVVMAFLSAFAIYPGLMMLLNPVLGWPTAFKVGLWLIVSVYALLLVRWSKTKILSILFPLVLLLGAALWPYVYTGYFLLLLGILCWIRSGICFQDKPVRTIAAELITVVGGMSLVAIWLPSSMLQCELGILLFGLIQCLYFYIIGYGQSSDIEKVTIDQFEQARNDLERVLESQ